MSITPILHTVVVKAAPARAFELFTTRMGDWWPGACTIGKARPTAIVIEPCSGGRWFERDAEGNETLWGSVLAWDPPARLVLAWQIGSGWSYDPKIVTEVELTFAPADGRGTRVTLEHRNLERFGIDAAGHAEALRGGWPSHVAAFADFTKSRS